MSESGFLAILFAATYPERTKALILMGSFARYTGTDDYPYRKSKEEFEEWIEDVKSNWGGPIDLGASAPDVAHEPWASEWFGGLLRYSASMRTACELALNPVHVDVREVMSD